MPLATSYYGPSGVLRSDSCTSYVFDGFDRLGTSTPNTLGACGSRPSYALSSYTYDGLDRQRSDTETTTGTSTDSSGNTAKFTLPASTTTMGYDGTSSQVATETVDSTPTHRYTLDADGNPTAVNWTDSNGNPQTQHLGTDGDGNVTEITGTVTAKGTPTKPGNVVCSTRSDAWGAPLTTSTTTTGVNNSTTGAGVGTSPSPCQTSPTDGSSSSVGDAFYRGDRRDTGSGDYQLGDRTYDPSKTAFISPDGYRAASPAGDLALGTDPLTADRYNYANGDPVNGDDPDGHSCAARDDDDLCATSNGAQSAAAASAPTSRPTYYGSHLNYGQRLNNAHVRNAAKVQVKACRRTGDDCVTSNPAGDNAESIATADQYQQLEQAKEAQAAKNQAQAEAQAKAAQHCGFSCQLEGGLKSGFKTVTDVGGGTVAGIGNGLASSVGIHTHFSLCAFTAGNGQRVCNDSSNVGKVAGFAGGVVVVTVGTDGLGDLAVAGRTAEAAGDGVDAIRAGDAAADGAGDAAADGAGDAGSDEASDDVACSTNSFPAGTTVATKTDGTGVDISTLQPGDTLLSKDSATGAPVLETVAATYEHTDSQTTDISLTVTPAQGSSTTSVMRTTPGHVLYDATTGHWTTAAQLHSGDHLSTTDGSTVTVTRVHTWTHNEWMYDLTVNTTHAFYIDAGTTTPLLVHNCEPLQTQVRRSGTQRLTPSQLDDLAAYNGYQPTNLLSKGRAIYSNGKNYVTEDIKSHNGGIFKIAKKSADLRNKSTRAGTTDAFMNVFKN